MKTWRAYAAKVTIRNSIPFYLAYTTNDIFFASVCVILRVSLFLASSTHTHSYSSFSFKRTSITTEYGQFGVPNYDDEDDVDDEGRCFLFDTFALLCAIVCFFLSLSFSLASCVCVCLLLFNSRFV